MYIARQKRAENIAEYILYLWQLEDLLRAMQFSPEAIFTKLVQPNVQLSEHEQNELLLWYIDIAELLKKEGKEEHGHLDHTLHLIGDLNHLHTQLLSLPVGADYRNVWATVKDELPNLRKILPQEEQITDIELCFRALYATVLYRIKGDKVGEAAINDVITIISPLIALLAKIYRQVERGEIDLFKGV